MKKSILLLSVLALLTGTSCKTKEKVSNDSANKTTQADQKAKLVVSFISIGTGIDNDALDKLEKFVSKHPKKPAYTKSNWGREGEVELSFTLKEIKSSEQAKFIEELKKAVGDSDRVKYKEN